MLGKSMKAIAVVVMMGLLLVLTSALAAGASETGAMSRLDPGEQHWYTLTDQGNGEAQVGMNVDPDGAASFMVVTSDAIRAWEAGGELEIIGRGTRNRFSEADLTWSGSSGGPGTYHLIVEYTGNGQDPAFYSLDVSGAEISADALAEDPEYLQELLENPKEVLARQLRQALPRSLNVEVVTDTADTVYLVLPYSPPEDGELSDADLEIVAGGKAEPPPTG